MSENVVPIRPADRPWSDDEEKALVTAFLNGQSLEEIAEALDRTKEEVVERLVYRNFVSVSGTAVFKVSRWATLERPAAQQRRRRRSAQTDG